MMSTVTAALWMGKRMGLPEDFRMLMAGGNAVCGSSAIAAVAPAIGADEKQKGLAITMVNLTGTILMLVLPWLVGLLYSDRILPSSALIGGVLQSVVLYIGSVAYADEMNISPNDRVKPHGAIVTHFHIAHDDSPFCHIAMLSKAWGGKTFQFLYDSHIPDVYLDLGVASSRQRVKSSMMASRLKL